ncbi:MAG: hypothetical protein HY688_00650 [Chloroflexi bacterium]|nr:hypothetical protein [Chloroflexota bacterium]
MGAGVPRHAAGGPGCAGLAVGSWAKHHLGAGAAFGAIFLALITGWLVTGWFGALAAAGGVWQGAFGSGWPGADGPLQ